METVTDFTFLGSKIIADGDCNHEIKRYFVQQVSGGPPRGGAPHVWVPVSSQGSVWWRRSSWERFVLGESIGVGVIEETCLCSRK